MGAVQPSDALQARTIRHGRDRPDPLRRAGAPVNRYLSGALGGDQQVGAAIAEGRIDLVIFFSDPLAAHAHDVDVKALLRIAVLYDVPIACNRASADFMLSSPLMVSAYARHPLMPQDTPTVVTNLGGV